MKNDQPKPEQMTCRCPNDHKLRGSVDLIGKSVRCPRCNEKFVFGYRVRQDVTDTAVVRILGDAPAPPPAPQAEAATRPCSRCGCAISATATVCEHCHCYVGKLPDFFAKLRGQNKPSFN